MLGCLHALSESFELSADICRRDSVYGNRVRQFCRSLAVFSALSILGCTNIVIAANLLPIAKQLPVSNIVLNSHSLSNIQLAVHFRPGGVDQNQIGDTDSYDARLTQLLYSNECPGCDLRGANLQRKVLNGAKLPRADLNGARFDEAELSAADLTGAYLENASFEKVDIKGAKFNGAYMIGVSFENMDLQNANLQGIHIYHHQ